MMLKSLEYILNHPFNNDRKLKALYIWARWQLKTRISNKTYIHPFVNQTLVYVARGMTGVTGNIYCGLHEWEEMCFTLHLLRSQDTFADVGSNVGTYTLLASGAVGAKTYAFEPIPETYRKLLENIALNNIQCVHTQNIGLSDKPDTMHFTKGLDTMNHIEKSPNENTMSVPVEKLDDSVNQSLTLIKIDVEGYEYHVLRGSTGHLRDPNQQAIIVEWNVVNNAFGTQDNDLRGILEQHGYIPVKYNPIHRSLSQLKTNHFTGNVIFVKDLAFCADRVRTSPQFIVQGKRI